MPDPTPGQVAHEAYNAAFGARYPGPWIWPWAELIPDVQACWEAAAQAVREAHASLCPICNAELERCNTKESPHA